MVERCAVNSLFPLVSLIAVRLLAGAEERYYLIAIRTDTQSITTLGIDSLGSFQN